MKIIAWTFFILFASISQANVFNPEEEINRINLMKVTSPKKIHQQLLELKKKNSEYIQKLKKSRSYQPQFFRYSINLDLVLEKVNLKFQNLPNCSALKNDIEKSFQSSWEKLPPPINHISVSLFKICPKK